MCNRKGTNLGSINFVIHEYVVTEESTMIMDQALERAGKPLAD